MMSIKIQKMRNLGLKAFVLAIICGLSTTGFAITGPTIYVNASAAAGGDGTSWAKAFKSLDSALNAAASSTTSEQIWVAKGTYKPTISYSGGYSGTEANLKTFKLPSNVAIYGGFSGTETSLGQCKPSANVTILSGDIAGNDVNTPDGALLNKADNVYHVLTADGVTNVSLNGMTVMGGYASGPDDGTLTDDLQFNIVQLNYVHDAGGGMLLRHGAQVQLTNMLFQYNASDSINASQALRDPNLFNVPVASGGGAIGAYDEGTKLTVMNSTLANNQANNFGGHGGAITATHGATLIVSNSVFDSDKANRQGGAIHGKDGTITVSNTLIKNSIIVGNTIGDESGGGIGVIDSTLTVSNSVFDSNASSITASGGGIFFHTPFSDGEIYTLTVTNSIFKNNIAGVVGGGGIAISSFAPFTGSSASITNSLFSNNTGIDGGAVYTDGIPTLINNSIFNNNIANALGGAVFATNFNECTQTTSTIDISQRPLLTITNSVFNGNKIAGTAPLPPVVIFNIFAQALSNIFSGNGPIASVTTMTPGGGAIAAEFASNVTISKSLFQFNTAAGYSGGAIFVGGSIGTPGAMNQNFVTISKSVCFGNMASTGNNSAVLDLAGLGATPNGVQLQSDGSCN